MLGGKQLLLVGHQVLTFPLRKKGSPIRNVTHSRVSWRGPMQLTYQYIYIQIDIYIYIGKFNQALAARKFHEPFANPVAVPMAGLQKRLLEPMEFQQG